MIDSSHTNRTMLKLEPMLDDVDEFGMLPYTTDIDRFLNIKVSIQTIERLKGAEEFWTTDVDSQQTSGFCPAKHQDCDFEAFLSLLDVQHTVVKMKAPQTENCSAEREAIALKSHAFHALKQKRSKRTKRIFTGKSSAIRSTQFAQHMLELTSFRHTPCSQRLNARAFPQLQASDALMFFPSAMVSFMNSGDMQSLSELFASFMHPMCTVSLPRTSVMGQAAPASRFLLFQRLLLDMHPDMILCMNTTEQAGNEVKSEIFFKFTENRTVYESVARSQSQRDSCLSSLLVPSRAEHLSRKFDITTKTDEEWRGLSGLLDSGADVELSGRIDLQLFFNKHSRRILDMKLDIRLTRCHRILHS